MPSDKYCYANGACYARLGKEMREYFYEEGRPKTIEPYSEGVLHGEVLLYWPNGTLKRKCSFHHHLRHGLDQIWNEQGILVDEGTYERGKPTGAHRRWNDQGRLIEEISYLDEQRFDFRQWDEQGNLRTEALWEGGVIYRERSWDRFQNIWIEKEGRFDGKKICYV